MADLHNLLGELRQFVDAVAGENRPSREWAIDLRTKIDAIPERALAERAGGVKVDDLAQEIRRVDGSHTLGAGALAEALMPFLTTEPAAPEGRQEAVAYGESIDGKIVSVHLDKSRHCTVPLYTRPSEQAVTEAAFRHIVEAGYHIGFIKAMDGATDEIREVADKAKAALKAAMEAGLEEMTRSCLAERAGRLAAEAERDRLREALTKLCDWVEHEVGAELPFDARAALKAAMEAGG